MLERDFFDALISYGYDCKFTSGAIHKSGERLGVWSVASSKSQPCVECVYLRDGANNEALRVICHILGVKTV